MVTQGWHPSLSCVHCCMSLSPSPRASPPSRILPACVLPPCVLPPPHVSPPPFHILLACRVLPPPHTLCLLVASSHVVLIAHRRCLVGACSSSAHCRMLSPHWHLFLSACRRVSWSCCHSMLLLDHHCAVLLLSGCSHCAVLLLSCRSCPVYQEGGLGMG